MPTTTIRHTDKRTTIPTAELAEFVPDDDKAAKVVRYPRDPSLDPQLVWKGKDEQDSADLEVRAPAIYVQEKVAPKALIDDLQAQKQHGKPAQADLFADFDGVTFDELVAAYQHHDKQNWSNRFILGDSLLVMNSLAVRENLKGRVQCIYFDPPYGIKFNSNWQVSTRKRDVKDGKVEDATRQPEQVKAFRDTWKLGIHSYLSYLRDRLVVARELLTESGSVFVQIGVENVHLVRCVLDECLGAENFCAQIAYKSMMPLESGKIEQVLDYVLWYARDIDQVKYRNLWVPKRVGGDSEFVWCDAENGFRRLETDEIENIEASLAVVRVFKRSDLASSGYTESCTFPIAFEGQTFTTTGGKSWRTNAAGIQRLTWANRLFVLGKKLYYKLYHADFGLRSQINSWDDTIAFEKKAYVVETVTTIVQRCLLMTTDPGDLVLDPTCGSGTTAYVAEQWGRRWITIDTSRVALALARTRLMAAKYPYYILEDSPEGLAKNAELHGRPVPRIDTKGDIKKGFVCKRVPHVTLKSIANNPDIKPGMSRADIDAAIARHADVETLVDQPYEDKKRIRVAGPFTVESLSPHRVLDADLERPASEGGEDKAANFVPMIVDNLRAAGVQNTKKLERLIFDRLDVHPGQWLHAEGDYYDSAKELRRVAVSIGPEHGTVGEDHVKEAAKEAVKGAGFDLILVCGFAFDAHAVAAAAEFAPAPSPAFATAVASAQKGKIQVLLVRMNPDLAMGDELLKKTGSANLFMTFGEPDIEVRVRADGLLEVEVRGVDVYDPTTGQIRSSQKLDPASGQIVANKESVADIACWFLDTDYNDEAFFVRHAYFLGADEPYEKLKKALRAEIDEAAWSALYKATSRPFARPKSGRIAVKVINHYGDEVLMVVRV